MKCLSLQIYMYTWSRVNNSNSLVLNSLQPSNVRWRGQLQWSSVLQTVSSQPTLADQFLYIQSSKTSRERFQQDCRNQIFCRVTPEYLGILDEKSLSHWGHVFQLLGVLFKELLFRLSDLLMTFFYDRIVRIIN